MISASIITIAKSYLGQEEIVPNKGFKDKNFELEMKSVGWYINAPWCSFLAIRIWEKAYSSYSAIEGKIKKLVSGNSQQMARNFHADPLWPTSTSIPKLGSLVIWGDGNSTTSGHTGIVISIDPDGKHFTSIEGNTSDPNQPSIREGFIVAQHTHIIGAPHSSSGLNLLRFIYPIESL